MATLHIKNVRLGFPALFKPQGIPGTDGKPAYGARLIISPKHPAVKAIDNAMRETAQAKWTGVDKAGKPVWEKILDKLILDGDVAFLKKDYCNKDGDVFDGFEDMYSLGCRSETVKPGVFDRDRTPLSEADGRIYSGCYVNAKVDFWAQDNSFGRGIRAVLAGVQFFADGDAFAGGRPASADDFDDLGVDEDEDDLG